MSVYLKLGDTLPLELQLGDGDKFPTTKVFARIDELDGTPIQAEFELTNNGDGNYTDDNYTMPANSAIKVMYFIRKSNGTSPETKYNPYYLTELFLRDLTAELVESNLDKKISSITCPTDLSVILEDNQLTAQIEEVALEVVLKDNKLIGVVNEC